MIKIQPVLTLLLTLFLFLSACRDDDDDPQSKPEISFVNLQDGDQLSGTTIIEIEASDPEGIAEVELFVNNQTVGSDQTSPYQISIDSRQFAEGQTTVTAIATDNEGEESEVSAEVEIVNTLATLEASPQLFEQINSAQNEGIEVRYWVFISNEQGEVTDGFRKLENTDPIVMDLPQSSDDEQFTFNILMQVEQTSTARLVAMQSGKRQLCCESSYGVLWSYQLEEAGQQFIINHQLVSSQFEFQNKAFRLTTDAGGSLEAYNSLSSPVLNVVLPESGGFEFTQLIEFGPLASDDLLIAFTAQGQTLPDFGLIENYLSVSPLAFNTSSLTAQGERESFSTEEEYSILLYGVSDNESLLFLGSNLTLFSGEQTANFVVPNDLFEQLYYSLDIMEGTKLTAIRRSVDEVPPGFSPPDFDVEIINPLYNEFEVATEPSADVLQAVFEQEAFIWKVHSAEEQLQQPIFPELPPEFSRELIDDPSTFQSSSVSAFDVLPADNYSQALELILDDNGDTDLFQAIEFKPKKGLIQVRKVIFPAND